MGSFVKRLVATTLMAGIIQLSMGQTATISGKVIAAGKPVEWANIELAETQQKTLTDTLGRFSIEKVAAGTYKIRVTNIGFHPIEKTVSVKEDAQLNLSFDLTNFQHALNDVVVTGTLKE